MESTGEGRGTLTHTQRQGVRERNETRGEYKEREVRDRAHTTLVSEGKETRSR